MHEEAPTARSHGTIAVLALLFSVLFSAAQCPTKMLGADARSSAVGQSDKGKGAALLRAAGRTQSDDDRRDDGSASSPGRPAPEPLRLASRPGTGLAAGSSPVLFSRAARAYQARAPPAAA